LRGIDACQVDGVQQMPDLPVLGKLPPPEPSAPLPPAVKTRLAAFLQRNREALQFFAQGAQYEQSRYPIDLTKGADTLLPHLAGLKKGAQICGLAAILDAETGEGKKSADDVLMTLALARSLKTEPTQISQLVRGAGVSLAVDALNQSANRTALPSESLSALSRAFQEMEDYDTRGEGFNRGLVAERACHLALLKQPKQLAHLLSTPGAFGLNAAEDRRFAQYLKNADLKVEQDFLEATFQQLWLARQAALPERLTSFADALHQRIREASDRGLLFNKTLWSAMENSVSREANCVAKERLALTALALEQFRAAHGNRYPDGLSRLTPEFLAAPLMDPFDGQPLRYRLQGKGYVLYSLGPRLKDYGGQRVAGSARDLIFAVVTPPAEQ
jgi:hypothetical protein